MNEALIFAIYLAAFGFVGYSCMRQAQVLRYSTNGTRFTQWTFMAFNISFFLLTLGKILEMKGVNIYYPEEVRAVLFLFMAVIGFVFYTKG